MKSIYFLLFTTLLIQLSHAQPIERKIVANENSEVVNKGFSENGTPFLIVQEKSEGVKEVTFTKYNPKSLDKIFEFKTQDYILVKKMSQNAETIVYDKQSHNSFKLSSKDIILNEKGESKTFNELVWIPKSFKPINDFIAKNHYIGINYYKKYDEKNGKNGENKLFTHRIYKKNLTTLKENYIDIDLFHFFQILENSNNDFVVLSKYFSNINKKKIAKTQDYTIKTIDFNGVEKKKVSFKTHITDPELRFKTIFAGEKSHRILKIRKKDGSGIFESLIWQPSSSGLVHHDKKNDHYYSFSVTAGIKKSKSQCALMIDKFDSEGQNIWSKKVYLDVKQKKGKGFDKFPNEMLVKDFAGKLGIMIGESENDYFLLANIDKENGDFVNRKSFNNIKTSYRKFIGLTAITDSGDFSSNFSLKDNFRNYSIDVSTLMAYALNENYKSYVDSYPDNSVNLYSKITEDGINTILTDYDLNEIILLHFNHKGILNSSDSK